MFTKKKWVSKQISIDLKTVTFAKKLALSAYRIYYRYYPPKKRTAKIPMDTQMSLQS